MSSAELATHALPLLRAAHAEGGYARAAEALATATTLLAERAIELGRPKAAIEMCSAAVSLLDHTRSARPSLRCDVIYWMHVAGFFVREQITSSLAGLEELLTDAINLNLVADASVISMFVAGAYSGLGHPERALAILSPMMDTIRRTCMGQSLGGSLLELAGAYAALGRASEAYPLIEEARVHASSGSFVFALSFVIEARAAMQGRDPLRALRAAHRSIELMTILGRHRYVGSGLRFQALALDALGKRKSALPIMAQSLDLLDAYGHPNVVARAHVDAARLSGDRRRLAATKRRLIAEGP